MPPASSKNIGVARFDASSRARISGRLFGEPGVPSGSLTVIPTDPIAHTRHRCRSWRGVPTACGDPRGPGEQSLSSRRLDASILIVLSFPTAHQIVEEKAIFGAGSGGIWRGTFWGSHRR